jgi:hypothetical protein
VDICHRCCPVFLSGQAGPALHWPRAGLSGDFQMRAEPAGFSAGFEGFSGRLAGFICRFVSLMEQRINNIICLKDTACCLQ